MCWDYISHRTLILKMKTDKKTQVAAKSLYHIDQVKNAANCTLFSILCLKIDLCTTYHESEGTLDPWWMNIWYMLGLDHFLFIFRPPHFEICQGIQQIKRVALG